MKDYMQLRGRLSDYRCMVKIMSRSLLTPSCLSFIFTLVRYTLQLWLSYPQFYTSSASLSLLSSPPPTIFSPPSEPRAKMKPRGDGETSLWTNFGWWRLSNGPIMSPHFGTQSKSNVRSADNVSNQSGNYVRKWERERRRGVENNLRRRFTATSARCWDNSQIHFRILVLLFWPVTRNTEFIFPEHWNRAHDFLRFKREDVQHRKVQNTEFHASDPRLEKCPMDKVTQLTKANGGLKKHSHLR